MAELTYNSFQGQRPAIFVAVSYNQAHQKVGDPQYVLCKGCFNIDTAGLRP